MDYCTGWEGWWIELGLPVTLGVALHTVFWGIVYLCGGFR